MEGYSARTIEESEINVLLGESDRMNESENNSFKRSVELGKINSDIMSTCNHCKKENNLTRNKSTFCRGCGALLTNRHY